MKKIKIQDNEYQTSWCYPQKRLLKHEFHRYCAGELFQDIMTKNLDVFEQYKCTKLLSDDRNYGPVHPGDIEWGMSYWGPRMLEAGWKYWGMVLPPRVIGQMSLKKMLGYYEERGVEPKLFSDPDEAMEWLDSKGATGRTKSLIEPNTDI